MKICPKCEAEHNKPGTFCSRACANSRKFSEESRLRKSKAVKAFYKENEPKPSKFKGSKRPIERTEKQLKTCIEKSIVKFQNGQVKDNSTLKKVLAHLRGYKCEECSLTEWRGKALMLDIDHIDGNNKNNTPSNVRLLCPNCHRQTPTWGNKNR